MHKIAGFATLGAAMVAVTGCQQAPLPAPVMESRSVLDVKPVHRTSTFAMSPQRVTPPDEPQAPMVTTPVALVTPSPAKPEKKGKSAGHGQQASAKSAYTVKKGDTLYHIAKTEYGDGKKWTQIASANPGVSPHSLRAGQTLMIP